MQIKSNFYFILGFCIYHEVLLLKYSQSKSTSQLSHQNHLIELSDQVEEEGMNMFSRSVSSPGNWATSTCLSP